MPPEQPFATLNWIWMRMRIWLPKKSYWLPSSCNSYLFGSLLSDPYLFSVIAHISFLWSTSAFQSSFLSTPPHFLFLFFFFPPTPFLFSPHLFLTASFSSWSPSSSLSLLSPFPTLYSLHLLHPQLLFSLQLTVSFFGFQYSKLQFLQNISSEFTRNRTKYTVHPSHKTRRMGRNHLILLPVLQNFH